MSRDQSSTQTATHASEYAPGAPGWVKAYPIKIIGAAKVTLWDLWSRAPHRDQRGCLSTIVYVVGFDELSPARALACDIAAGTGQSERQVRDHLTILRRLGLMRTSGRTVRLYWRPDSSWVSAEKSATAAGAASESAEQLDGSPAGAAEDLTATAESPAATAEDSANQLNSPKPQDANPHLTADVRARAALIREQQGWRSPGGLDDPKREQLLAAFRAWPGHTAWAIQLEHPQWLRTATEAMQRLGLSAERLVELCVEYEREREELRASNELRRREAAGFPQRHTLFWTSGPQGRHARAWVTEALARLEVARRAPRSRRRSPLVDPCSEDWGA